MTKRYIIPYLLSLFLILSLSLGVSAAEPEGNWNDLEEVQNRTLEGNGTFSDPYLIQDECDLAYFSYNTTKNRYTATTKDPYQNKFVKITAEELDMSAHYWTPAIFSGYFDGNNCVIKGITVNVTKKPTGYTTSAAGFFYVLNTAAITNNILNNVCVVQNVHLENPQISSTLTSTNAGALAGIAQNVRISNCTVSGGSVSGEKVIAGGGLIGALRDKTGGDISLIERCFSTASVTSTASAGGLIGSYGSSENGGQITLSDCWSGGDVSGGSYVGGLIGYIGSKAYGMDIDHCYSISSVTGNGSKIGGLIGFAEANGTNSTRYINEVNIQESVAINPSLLSELEGNVSAGRIVGNGADIVETQKGILANNHALDVMTVLGQYADDDDSVNGSGVRRETIMTQTFWEDTVGFDFSENGAWVWDDAAAENGRPVLKNNELCDCMSLGFSMEPRDSTVYKTMAATFGVTASGGAMGYTYQWQIMTADDEEWQDVEDAMEAAFTVNYGTGYLTGTQVRCIVTDQAGQTAVSASAELTVVNAKYTAEDASKALVAYYRDKGTLSSPKEAFGLASANADLSEFTADLPFWTTYSKRYGSADVSFEAYPWILMDSYALGTDPHSYIETDGGNSIVKNLFVAFLNQQDEETGEIFYDFCYYPIPQNTLPSIILGLEMYFDGGEWGNEAEGTKLGRDGAIEYFFSRLKDHSSGGLVFELEEREFFYPSSLRTQSEEFNIREQLLFSEAAILAARLVDDPKWGDQAEEALSGLMKTLEYLYDTREDTTDHSSFTYSESLARYVSALIAAGNATDNWFKQTAYFNLADEIVKEQLLPAKCIDGSYNAIAGESSVTGDADATAAVMMALGDYENQSSILMDYVFDIPDESAAANDLAEIEINSPVTADLELPVSGLYGSEITWETSDKNIISAAGKVNRGAEDKTVTLTATATKGEAVATRSFELVVKADADAATDAIDAVLAGLSVPIETIHDIVLGVSADDSVTLTWTSSDETVLASDGTVVRPTVGESDNEVTLTATAVQGEVSKTKEFTVKVYAETGDSLQEAYYLTRDKYLNHKNLGSYWKVWAAYAALGDYITDPANGYVIGVASPSSDWYGTQYGASVNAIVAMGENPYDYLDKNWVQLLKDNYGGPYAGTVYSELGMEAAGAGSDYYTPSAAAGINMTKEENMKLGIDIAGWAAVILAAHHGEDDVDAAAENFISYLKNSMGVSENGNFATSSGGNVNFISTGCGIMGMAALYSVGYEEADVTAWANETTGKTPVDAVYDQCFLRNEQYISGYDEQIEIAVCDLYNAKYNGGTSTWISCRVSAEKLEAQKAKAAEILENRDLYEAESIEAIETALETVNGISEERLSKSIADYGEEYYALYDAVRYAQRIGQAEKDAEAAAVVSEQLNVLGDAESITLDDKSAVEAARAAYDALTKDQKALVDEDALAKLTAAEDKITALEKDAQGEAAIAAAEKAMFALPDKANVTLKDAEAVEAARAAYDALTEDQQAAVDAKAVQRLTEAEAKIEALSGKELGDISKFTDVKEGDWFYDSVDYVVSNGVFNGTSATTFSPQDPMTRAMFITVVGRHAGVKDSDSASPVYAYFDDVVSGQYYASHVKWGVDNGVTLGIGGGLFGTNNSITRQDMATMMVRYAKVIGMNLPEADGTLFADDGEISDYAKDAVYRLKAAGILTGRENNVFDPKATCTRAEVAAVLQRFMTHKDTVVMTMEKFTLGRGYVIEPMLVEVEEGDTAADVFMRAAKEKGMEYRCSYSSGTFYLSTVKDNDTGEAVIPQYILDAAGGEVSGRNTENWLGEFDYNGTAGWMIIVNNKKPTDANGFELGAGQTEVKPGDVIRWMFTVVGLGRDLGIDQIASNNLITAADKDALTAAVAKADSKTKDSDAYKAALQVLMNLQASQAEVDAALDALK